MPHSTVRFGALFMDLDDTLWDFSANSHSAMQLLYQRYEWDRYFLDFDACYQFYAFHNNRLWTLYHQAKIEKSYLMHERFRALLAEVGITDAATIDKIGDEYLIELARQPYLISGARALLDYLQPRYPLYIISNGFEEVQYTKLNSSGIAHYFKGVILSDHVGVNKPHPDIYTYALQQAAVTAEQALMIGDNIETDIAGAIVSGIATVYYNPKGIIVPSDMQPTYQIKQLDELMQIL